jgi:imidazolonepropionase-like amidohydrolase
MACGENPKRVYGELHRDPSTRMGVIATMRASFQKALEYQRAQNKWQRDMGVWQGRHSADDASKLKADGQPDDPPEPPVRDLGLETLVGVLEGRILVHNHCYRADEMSEVLDLAHEFGFHIRSFHHALEAYKIADRLAAEGVAVSTWVDWWGFKMEALDGVPQNVAMVFAAGGRPILHSDSPTEIRHLNQEAAKARAAGEKFGLTASDDEVLKWVTANPAWALGLEKEIGTLEVGKRADVVVWSGSPFSVYTLAQTVMIDGAVIYDRQKHQVPISDYELGSTEPGDLP